LVGAPTSRLAADFPAGYFSPEATPAATGAKTLLLTHTNRLAAGVADVMLEDDRLIEISADGTILWEWLAGDHIDEYGFDARARAAIKAAPGFSAQRGSFDALHINSATYVGPNRAAAGDGGSLTTSSSAAGRRASSRSSRARPIAWRSS
jgi:hypothetical protein